MASDYALGQAIRAERPPLLALAGYLAILALLFVGLDPFSPPAVVSQFGSASITTGGDSARQLAYLVTAGLVLAGAISLHGASALRAIPLTILLLLAWCLASALWAQDPGTVARRAILQIIVVTSLLFSIDSLGARRCFWLWSLLLALVLAVNILSIPLISAARHGFGEQDPALVGNWRGLYGHKNIAGGISAITVILFLFSRTGRSNWIGLMVAAAALFFLVMTRSKSSLGFLPIALAAGYFYKLGWREGLSRTITFFGVLLCLAVLAAFLLLDAEAISRMLSDPTEFTGRSAIWAAELAYIADHPLLGAGFGAFTDTKGISPLHGYVSGNWVESVSHGHNGYLQVLVTVGGIGFVLTVLAVIVRPLTRFWRLTEDGDLFRPMLFALFTFLLLRNFMESDLLEGGGAWAALIMIVAALREEHIRPRDRPASLFYR
jgi:O-antigen ligase